MNVTKLVSLLLTLLLAVAMLAGCQSAPAEQPAAEPSTNAPAAPDKPAEQAAPADETALPGDGLKVGLLVPDSIIDPGWSQVGANGMKAAEANLGFKLSIVEAGSSADIKTEAMAMAEEGYDYIVGHGGEYGPIFREICAEYPDVVFLTQGGTSVADNLHVISEDSTRGVFLCGVMASRMSKTGMAGAIIAGEYSQMLKTACGFREGFVLENPDNKCITSVVASGDVNEAYEVATAMIQQGCEYFFFDCDSGNAGVLRALEENGLYGCSSTEALNETNPQQVPFTVITDYSNSYPAVMDHFINGTAVIDERGYVVYGYLDGQWDIHYSEELKATLPAEVLAVKDTYIDDVINDVIHVPTAADVEAGRYDAFVDNNR